MSPSSDSVRVTIHGDEYLIKGDVDIETTRQVAQYVNSKMEEIQTGVASRDKVKIAVLSAMNIAGNSSTAGKSSKHLRRKQTCSAGK